MLEVRTKLGQARKEFFIGLSPWILEPAACVTFRQLKNRTTEADSKCAKYPPAVGLRGFVQNAGRSGKGS